MKHVGWDGAVVLLTAASRGIGRAVAKAATDRGARVGLVARTESDLRVVLDEIGGRGAVAVADVASREEAERAVAVIEADLGPIDVVVANVGGSQVGSLPPSRPSTRRPSSPR